MTKFGYIRPSSFREEDIYKIITDRRHRRTTEATCHLSQASLNTQKQHKKMFIRVIEKKKKKTEFLNINFYLVL